MRTEPIQEEVHAFSILPLCEANRQLVIKPTSYVSNVVFTVGALTFIDKAP